MTQTNNIDKLPLEVIGMMSILFKGEIEGFENAYMVEIKIDDPIKHIKEGNEFFIIHQSIDQYLSNATYMWDKDWAVFHKQMFNMTTTDEGKFNKLLENFRSTTTFESSQVFCKKVVESISNNRPENIKMDPNHNRS